MSATHRTDKPTRQLAPLTCADILGDARSIVHAVMAAATTHGTVIRLRK